MKSIKIICISILLFFTVNSFGQNSFNWSDTSFQINSKKTIKLSYDLESNCSVNPCYDLGTNNLVYDTIIKFLKENPTLKIEIGFHVDYKKNTPVNSSTSITRSDFMKEVLIEHGIDKERIIAVGYGNSKQIIPESEIDLYDKNEQWKYRMKNTRIEITILEK